jgi:hypothetical protein
LLEELFLPNIIPKFCLIFWCFILSFSLSLSLSLNLCFVGGILSLISAVCLWPADRTEEGLFMGAGGGVAGLECSVFYTGTLSASVIQTTRLLLPCFLYVVNMLHCCYPIVYIYVGRFRRLKWPSSLMSLIIHPHNGGYLSFYTSEFIWILYAQKLSCMSRHYFWIRTYWNTVL